MPVRRAVEGTHGCLAEPAARIGALFVQGDRRRLIALDPAGPHVIDVGADHIDEGARLVRRAALTAFRDAGAPELAGQLGGGPGVDVEDEIADRGQDQDADPAAGHGPAAESAPVVDVAATPSALPTHDRSPSAPETS